jgi:hypothetical protein
MKFITNRAFADPDAAVRKLVEIANTVEAVQERSHLYRARQRAVPRGWRQRRGVSRRCRARDRQGLAMAA